MAIEEEDVCRERSPVDAVVGGLMRIGLLFGSLAVVATALFVSSVLDARLGRDYAESRLISGVDQMSTGSIGYAGTYTHGRSVLQASAGAVCDNGIRSGGC